ncbi:MAG: hypothetical protein WC730_03290 [Patescibacteria group bacterium]|jgi:hypothetical protein
MFLRALSVMGILVFFGSCFWVSSGVGSMQNSPDERANYLFAQHISDGEAMSFSEPANTEVQGIIHPRSMAALGEKIVPGSFLGLPVLAGFFGFIDENLIFIVTPLLAVLAVLAWFSLVKKMFENRWLAYLASFFLAIHPAFWYYAGRPLMHNVGFVSFLILAAWVWMVKPVKNSWTFLNPLLGGFFLAWALAFRSAEAIWVLPAVIILFAVGFRKKFFSFKDLLFSLGGFVVILLPFLLLNFSLYGSPFLTGYTLPASSSAVSSVVVETSWMTSIAQTIFPFGIHEMNIVQAVWHYGFLLYPTFGLLALLGIGVLLVGWKKESPAWKRYFFTLLPVVCWLVVVYGSWKFNDNPDPFAITIGNSYARYWLPIFALLSPFMARAILWIADVPYPRLKQGILVVILLASLGASGWVVFGGEDGFIKTREHLAQNLEKKEIILAATPDNAIIIVDRADKYLFPDRRVVVPLRSDVTYDRIDELASIAPLYYFGITLPDVDIDYLNTTILGPHALILDRLVTVGEETLYAIE